MDNLGTSQGSKISPLLFNIAMDPWIKNLERILGYKGDVFAWADDLIIVMEESML